MYVYQFSFYKKVLQANKIVSKNKKNNPTYLPTLVCNRKHMFFCLVLCPNTLLCRCSKSNDEKKKTFLRGNAEERCFSLTVC